MAKATFKKLKWSGDLLGSNVTVITNKGVNHDGFNERTAYKGKLLDKVDWLVGCPIFECGIGVLGLNYDCYLVEKVEDQLNGKV